MLGNDNGTDGQTDRQSATQYAAPSHREEGRIISEEFGRVNVTTPNSYLSVIIDLVIQ